MNFISLSSDFRASGTKAFTLLEVMVALSIVLLVAAIAYPVLAEAKRGARQTASVQNLRQLYLLTKLYCDEYNGNDSAYSSTVEMGLPPEETLFATSWKTRYRSILTSPFGPDDYTKYYSLARDNGLITWAFVYYQDAFRKNPRRETHLKTHAERYKQNAVMYFDMFANNGVIVDSPYTEKRILSVLLSGEIVNTRRKGNVFSLDLFAGPNPDR